jgi:hypothetical protein
MKTLTTRLLVAILTFAIGVTAATVWILPKFRHSGAEVPAPPAVAAELPKPGRSEKLRSSPTPDSPIRRIDFENVAYPNYPDYDSEKEGRITLKPGEGGPHYLSFGDVTGDGEEEAMAVLGISLRGSAIPDYVYIFTLKRGRLKLLWDFETGDRADGGFKRIYAAQGNLVIELYGKDRFIGGKLYKGDEGLCCPSSFTRTRYKWNGKRFVMTGREVLPNPNGNAGPDMP